VAVAAYDGVGDFGDDDTEVYDQDSGAAYTREDEYAREDGYAREYVNAR
jgi:hypothetical protein